MASISSRARSQSPRPQFHKRFTFSGIDCLESRFPLHLYLPLKVFGYFFLYALNRIWLANAWLVRNYLYLAALLVTLVSAYIGLRYEGAHQQFLTGALKAFRVLKGEVKFYGGWLLLGVASSIGLGAGLHTFVLFLGPHVAEIAMVAHECGSLDFPVKGFNRLSCKVDTESLGVTPLMILLKVLPQTLVWGFGTALGELPPYFVARAAAYAGKSTTELQELEALAVGDPGSLGVRKRLMLGIYQLLLRTGFFGIFVCASIPNPLFDLAGITCGHFLVPFATFFTAVVLGKGFVKAPLQVFTIIVLFSKRSLQVLLNYLKPRLPYIHDVLERAVDKQIASIRLGHISQGSTSGTKLIPLLWNSLIVLMLLYFLFSIIESLAQTYLQQHLAAEPDRVVRPARKRSRSM
ncbi:hypothetical protein L0F63_003177 [Massospora cicadina]|nr:hypothetical protein L0F63_003177 [Massospora cicadina]